MVTGHFYFVKNEFFERFSNCNLMSNKDNGAGRPCHYCFESNNISWMIPISSKVAKYRKIYNQKIQQRKFYDGIRFAFVNGKERAFLIQNRFPVTAEYLDNEYRLNRNTIPAKVSEKFSYELNALVRKVIRLHNRGIKITLTDLSTIIDSIQQDGIRV